MSRSTLMIMQSRQKRSAVRRLTERDFEAALGALSREQLCEFLRSYARSLDGEGRQTLDQALVLFDRGTGSGLFPVSRRDTTLLDDVGDFIRDMQGHGGDFFELDELLERAASVFQRSDYVTARKAYEGLLGAVASMTHAANDHDELATEFFTMMMNEAAARYLVSLYETTADGERAQAIWGALEGPARVGHLYEPLATLEHYAQDTLPDFDAFVARWVGLLEEKVRQNRHHGVARPERLLREATTRVRVALGDPTAAVPSPSRAPRLAGRC